MANYTKTNVGSAPRTELHDTLGLTGAEVSINQLPAGAGVPFVHAHQQNEEIYGILAGKGKAVIDGKEIALTAGDWLKVAPAAKRQFSAAADSSITYVCIQVKENSLGGFTANDEPQKTKRLCRVGRAFLRILLWQPIDRQSVADSAVAEAFFACNPLCSLLRRSALNHDAFPLLPRPVNQPIGQRRRIAAPPIFREQHPADFHAVLIVRVINHIADEIPVGFSGIHKRRFKQSCVMQKRFCLLPVERRLQMPHDFRVRKQLVQRVRVTGLHFANRDIHRFPPLNLNMPCVPEKSA